MIKEIQNKEEWNSFLLGLNPNTFLHSWEWGQVQQADGENVRYLGIYENDQQVGACLLLTINASRGRHLFIPHGPIFINTDRHHQYLPEIIDYARNLAKEINAVALRISPLLEATQENVEVFKQNGFRDSPMHVHAELTWVLDINKDEQQILDGMRKTTRHAIKKSQETGVEIEITTEPAALDRFMPLYSQTKQRHEFVPYSRELLESQLKEFGTNAYFVFAKHEDKDIAAGIFFQFGSTVFYYHGASLKTSSKISPAQLLQWESIKEAKRRGASLYNFWGIAPDDQPNHPFAGITIFKKGFGGRAINYMHAQDLPLSPMYWKMWAIDFYRKLKRGF